MISDERKSSSPDQSVLCLTVMVFAPKRGNGAWLLEDIPGQNFLLYGYFGVLTVWELETLFMIRWMIRIDLGFNQRI